MTNGLIQFFEGLDIPPEDRKDSQLDLARSPARMASMWRDELLSSYRPNAFDELVRGFTTFPAEEEGMVLEGPIQFHSVCSHHGLPFMGEAFVAYVPNVRIIGASKMARVVDYYSHMLQIQERLCRQVCDFIDQHAQPRVTIVLMRATHLCLSLRGAKQPNAKLITTTIRPSPGHDPDDRLIRPVLDEFYSQIALL
jgi:GTP cyclohydrolase I